MVGQDRSGIFYGSRKDFDLGECRLSDGTLTGVTNTGDLSFTAEARGDGRNWGKAEVPSRPSN